MPQAFFLTPQSYTQMSLEPHNPGSDAYGPRIWPRSLERSVFGCVCGEGWGVLPSPSSFGLIHCKEWSRAETFISRIQKKKENQEGKIRERWRMKGRRRRLRVKRREGSTGKRWGDGWARIILQRLQSWTWCEDVKKHMGVQAAEKTGNEMQKRNKRLCSGILNVWD